MKSTKGIEIDLNEKSKLFEAIQEHGHLVGHYFDLRTVIFHPRHGSSVQRQLLLVQTGIREVPWNDPLAWALLEVGQEAA